MFGVDVDGLTPGESVAFDAAVLGAPLDSLADVPAGTYYAQVADMGDNEVIFVPIFASFSMENHYSDIHRRGHEAMRMR
jgi:hypothetical protein